MSDELSKAIAAAQDAAQDTKQVEWMQAVVIGQAIAQAMQAQQPAPAPVQRPEFNPTKWLVIGGVVVSVGLVGALFAVAIAIGGVCATACLLVLRSMWRDYQGGR